MTNRILVSPEQLEQVARQFAQSGQQSQQMVMSLHQSVQQMEALWQGMTRERFYSQYMETRIRMDKFVESLHTVSKELEHIAVKFRQADQELNGAVGIGLSAGAGLGIAAGAGIAAGGAAAMGGGAVHSGQAAKGSGDDANLVNKAVDKTVFGVEAGGSVVSNETDHLFANAINGKAGASMQEGVYAEGSLVEAGFDTDYVDGAVSVGNASVEATIKEGNLNVGAEATITKYEGGLQIPLPFTDKELNIGGSASLGVVGGSASIGKSGISFHIPIGPGISLFGLGGSVTVK